MAASAGDIWREANKGSTQLAEKAEGEDLKRRHEFYGSAAGKWAEALALLSSSRIAVGSKPPEPEKPVIFSGGPFVERQGDQNPFVGPGEDFSGSFVEEDFPPPPSLRRS